MRIFAALPLPAPVSAAIRDSFAHARSLAPKIRWVGAEGMHVTLHFFGEIADSSVGEIKRLFDDPALQVPAIPARLGPLGRFPARGQPRVLWVGLDGAGEAMRDFYDVFTLKLSPLIRPGGPLQDWSPDERGFTPHVTVARSGSAPLSESWTQSTTIPPLEFLISECVLFQSLLGSGGARYVAQARIPFKEGRA